MEAQDRFQVQLISIEERHAEDCEIEEALKWRTAQEVESARDEDQEAWNVQEERGRLRSAW